MSMSIRYTLFNYLIFIGHFLLWIAVVAPYVGTGREQLLAQSSKKIENDTAKFIFILSNVSHLQRRGAANA